jgi:hypothetical protein
MAGLSHWDHVVAALVVDGFGAQRRRGAVGGIDSSDLHRRRERREIDLDAALRARVEQPAVAVVGG